MNGTVLAFDFGERRIGVAVGETVVRQAHPIEVIDAEKRDDRFARIGALIAEWRPGLLVVGRPVHMDGTPHEITSRAMRFANQLRGRFGLPVFEVDERYSTTEAHSLGAQDADAASAAIILEQFFRSLD